MTALVRRRICSKECWLLVQTMMAYKEKLNRDASDKKQWIKTTLEIMDSIHENLDMLLDEENNYDMNEAHNRTINMEESKKMVTLRIKILNRKSMK